MPDGSRAQRSEAELLRHTIDALPVGIVNVDAEGRIRRANDRLGEMVGLTPADMIGRSLLDFVAPDDHELAVSMLTQAARYTELMGPARVRYLDAAGDVWSTEVWGRNALDDPDLDGYLLVFTPESTNDGLAAATRAIAAGRPARDAHAELALSLARFPMSGAGSMLTVDGDHLHREGAWPVAGGCPAPRTHDDGPGDAPWIVALRTGARVDAHDAATQPAWLRDALAPTELRVVCARPVVGRAGLVGVLVAWLPDPGPPSANQDRWLGEAVAIAALAADQDAARRSLEADVHVDPLTGLANRRRLADLADDPTASVAGLLYVDLDGFKAVNDALGHDTGDEVLRQVGARLAGAVRTDDVAIRVGGDEFAVVCTAPIDTEGLIALGERLARVIAEPVARRDGDVGRDAPIVLAASIGIAVGSPGRSLHELVSLADRAMYRAKRDPTASWAIAGDGD